MRFRQGHGQRVRRLVELTDREWLERAYVVEGRTTREIAEGLGCSASAVGKALREQARAGG